MRAKLQEVVWDALIWLYDFGHSVAVNIFWLGLLVALAIGVQACQNEFGLHG